MKEVILLGHYDEMYERREREFRERMVNEGFVKSPHFLPFSGRWFSKEEQKELAYFLKHILKQGDTV